MQAWRAQAEVMEEIVIRAFRAEDAAWLIAQHGALYSETGGQMTEAKDVVSFGVPLVEQAWEISLSNPLAIAAMES